MWFDDNYNMSPFLHQKRFLISNDSYQETHLSRSWTNSKIHTGSHVAYSLTQARWVDNLVLVEKTARFP